VEPEVMTIPEPTLSELLEHPHRDELAAKVRAAALAARKSELTTFLEAGSSTAILSAGPEVEPAHANTSAGNVLDILAHGALSEDARAVVGQLLWLGLRADVEDTPESRRAALRAVLWLAAHTSLDAYRWVDATLGPAAEHVWRGLGELLDPLEALEVPRGEQAVAAVHLGASRHAAARDTCLKLAQRPLDSLVRLALARESESPKSTRIAIGSSPIASTGPISIGAATSGDLAGLGGELVPAPRSLLVTALFALTGWLFVRQAARILGRFAFGLRRPARLDLTDRGLELAWRAELLGRRIHEKSLIVPMGSLASVERELRFSRLGLYAGLGALALGSYLGMGLMVDGVRVPGTSPMLLGLGAAIVLIGLVIDFAFSALSDQTRTTCRLVIVPRRGRRLCIGRLDLAAADLMLRRVQTAIAEARELDRATLAGMLPATPLGSDSLPPPRAREPSTP
jgi:hypothetical protein